MEAVEIRALISACPRTMAPGRDPVAGQVEIFRNVGLSGLAPAKRLQDQPTPQRKEVPMLYAILAYHVEAEVMSWTPEQDAAVMTGLHQVHDRINQEGRLGPAARLGATKKARTLRGPGAGLVLDGPFAETKEQLLGFYVLDCATEEAAIAAARDLRRANPTAVYEIRPVALYLPGVPFPRTEAATDDTSDLK
jgi:hypothetical protein